MWALDDPRAHNHRLILRCDSMVILIMNMHYYKGPHLIPCDRSSPLGNIYHIGKDGDRDTVIHKYGLYLIEQVQGAKRTMMRKELNRIKRYIIEHGTVALGCWCDPRACHCHHIKARLQHELGLIEPQSKLFH